MSIENSANDRCLLLRVRAGDSAALIALYDTYAPSIYALALHVLKDSLRTEQLTEDIFIDLWRDPPGDDPARGIETYLKVEALTRTFRIVRHDSLEVNETAATQDPNSGLSLAPTARIQYAPLVERYADLSIPAGSRDSLSQ